MSTADGSVVLNVDMNVSDAEKKLAKLGNKVKTLEQSISEGQKKENSAAKEAERTYKSLEKAQTELTQAQEKLNTLTDQQAPLIQQLNKVRAQLEAAKAEVREYGEQWRSGVIGADRQQEHARVTTQELKKQYNEIAEKIEKMDPAILRASAGVEAQEAKVRQLSEAYGAAEQKANNIKSENEKLEKELAETKTEAGKLVQHIDDLKAERIQKIADSAKIADKHIVDLNQELLRLKERQKELEQAGVGLGYKEYDANTKKIAEMTAELKEYQKALADAGKGGGKQQPAAQAGERTIKSVLANLMAQLGKPIGIAQTFGSIISSIAKKMLNVGSSAAKFGTAAVKAFSRAVAGVTKLLNKVNILPKLFGSIRSSLERLGRIVKSALIFSVICKGLSLVRGQMGAYLGINTEFTTALGRLKGVLLTAFQPIYDIVVPALTTLINVLSRVIAAISQFTAVLFGTTAKQAQKNAKALYNQANATAAAGSAAEEAAGSLASFDEINTIQTEPSGGGGGGGAAAEAGPLFDWEYEETPFESWGEAFSAFLDKLLSGIPAIETAFGNFASWLNDFTKKLYDMFTFPGVQEKVQQLGSSLANAFNHLVDKINWYQLGQALGAGLNLALQFLVNFLYTFDWVNLGTRLAEMVNGLASKVDWYDFGRLLWTGFKIGLETLAGFILGLDMPLMAEAASNIVMGFFDSMLETIQKIDWSQIGLQIATFLNNIDWVGTLSSIAAAIAAGINAAIALLGNLMGTLDWAQIGVAVAAAFNLLISEINWAEIGETLSKAFEGALTFLHTALSNFDWEALGASIGEFLASINWLNVLTMLFDVIWEVISGLLDGLLSAITTFWENADPFEKMLLAIAVAVGVVGVAITALISIGAAASNMFTQLKTAIEGARILFGLLTSPIGLVVVAITAAITIIAVLITHFDGLQEAALTAWEGIKEAFGGAAAWLNENLIQPIVNGYNEHIKPVLEAFIEKLTEVVEEHVVPMVEKAIEFFGKVFEALQLAWNNILGPLVTWIIETAVPQIGNALEFAGEVFNTLLATVSDVVGGILEALGGVIDFLVGVFTGDWDRAWNGLIDIFKGVWNAIVSALEGAVNLIISGINFLIGALNKLHIDIPGTPFSSAMTIGFNIPKLSKISIPRLAQGAVIPANREFMAVLGDQSYGNNLEAPESLIRKIVREESGGGGETTALLQAILDAIKAGHIIMVDRRVLGQTVTQEQNRMTRQSGRSVLLG